MTSLLTSFKSFTLLLTVVCFVPFVSIQSQNATTQSTPICAAPTTPANGTVTINGSMATFTCDSGFEFADGSMEITLMCLASGNWSGSEPACEQAVSSSSTASPATPSAAVVTVGIASTAASATSGGSSAPDAANSTVAGMMTSTAAPKNTTDGDKDGHKGDGHKDTDGMQGGLSDGQIALAVLATFLIALAIGVALGLIYWKYRGTSYVAVSANY